jgi:superfamily II DNA or RNA helicase
VVANAAARGKRVCILVHRQELVDQVSASLANMAVSHGIIAAGHLETTDPIQVASVASLVRRLDRVVPFDLIVSDEAHHAVAGSWRAILTAMPGAHVLGVTATPERLDGRGLGDVFETMVMGPTVQDLTEMGFLVPAVVYGPPAVPDLSKIKLRGGDYAPEALAAAMSGSALVGDAVEHYSRLCRGKSAVAFCVDRKHSELVARRFADAGIRAAHVDGATDKQERRRLIAALRTGKIDVLTNCGLISEGVDVPSIGAAILLRPTKSLGLYLQQVGRALRPAAGKDYATILDHAGNSHRFGHPADPRQWSLEAKARRGRKAEIEPRTCPECEAVVPQFATTCPNCGAEIGRQPREMAEVDGLLIEMKQKSLEEKIREMPYRDLLQWADDEEKLKLAAKARGYHPGWIKHVRAAANSAEAER